MTDWRRQTMKLKGVKYQKLEHQVDIGIEYEDNDSRASPSEDCSCCCKLIDWLICGFFKLLLYAYRRVAKRYPHFLENNGEEILREECQRLLDKNHELTQALTDLRSEVDIKLGTIKEHEHTHAINLEKIRQRDKKIVALEQENKILEGEKQKALTRLSEQMAVQLRDNNPNIVDLSDPCRPTKLAEMFTELYDNEWTNAFSFLDEKIGEDHSIVILLDVFMEAYRVCENRVAVPWTVLDKWFLDMSIPGSKQVSKWLKDSRKAKIRNKVPEVKKEFIDKLVSQCNDSKIATLVAGEEMADYITKCIELCLLMVTTDPPVFVQCKTVKGSEDKSNSANKGEFPATAPHGLFDKELFREYMTRGYYLDYIVWPAMFLHKGGPLLNKGIAEGRADMKIEQRLWTWKKY